MRRDGPVTLKEVAQQAGVSPAAVSKVLHGRGDSVRVSDERAQVIREVAQRLQYKPNMLARSLRLNRTQTVGLIFENFGEIALGPLYYVYLLDGVASVLFQNHYRLTILSEVEDKDLQFALGDGRLDGVIWCKLASSELHREAIESCPVPLVALNTPPVPETGAVFVSCDNDEGSRLATEHLLELGHRKILFVGESGEEETPDNLARAQGFQKAMASRGLPTDDNDVVTWSPRACEFHDWWKKNTGHTAIFGWNERMAAEVLRSAREAGVAVPRQLSVIGFDSTRYCETTQPRLTAVRQPVQQMAAKAARILLALIEGQRPEHDSYVFPCTLDVRDSTSTPPQSRGD